MCRILLSINPEYSAKILEGIKKYEYRRQIAKRDVDEILIYSTAPEMRIIGSVKVKEVLSESPLDLWNKTCHNSGICKEKYMAYFSGKERAYAYRLGEITPFNPPKKLSDFGIKTAPQSFMYI